MALLERLSTMRTSQPSSDILREKGQPIKPSPPATIILFIDIYSYWIIQQYAIRYNMVIKGKRASGESSESLWTHDFRGFIVQKSILSARHPQSYSPSWQPHLIILIPLYFYPFISHKYITKSPNIKLNIIAKIWWIKTMTENHQNWYTKQYADWVNQRL